MGAVAQAIHVPRQYPVQTRTMWYRLAHREASNGIGHSCFLPRRDRYANQAMLLLQADEDAMSVGSKRSG